MFGGVAPSAGGDEEGYEILRVAGVELEVTAVDGDGGGDRAVGEDGEAEEERPHAVVLRDGKRAQRAVERVAGAGEEALSRSEEAYMCQTRGIRDMPAASARSKAALRPA